MGHCARRLWVLGWLLVPSLAPPAAGAQLPPIGVPRGTVRMELDGVFESFDRVWLDGTRRGLAADLSSPALGADRIPALAEVDARLSRITGDPAARLNLGALTADAEGDISTGTVGVGLGLTNAITIFGRLPLVRSRVQSELALDPAAGNAGVAPSPDEQAAFFDQFDAALASVAARLAAGEYDADPAARALAEATLAGGTDLRSDLFGLLGDPETASPFLPLAASPTGAALSARVAALQGTLATSLGVPGFTLAPALPSSPLTRDELLDYLGPAGPGGFRLGDSPVSFRGDAEAGAVITLADRWDRGGRPGGFRAAVEGLVRFPTGVRARSNRLLELGTGEGQTDVEVRLTTDVGGGRWGARLRGGYTRQLASDIAVRVTAPGQPFVGPERLTSVRRDPGDMVGLDALPFFRLARTLAIQGVARYWSRGADAVSYSAGGELPGVDPTVLADDTKATALVVGGGITYTDLGGLRPGGRGLPVEASWTYERVVRATGGRVPDATTVRARFRLYYRLFGK